MLLTLRRRLIYCFLENIFRYVRVEADKWRFTFPGEKAQTAQTVQYRVEWNPLHRPTRMHTVLISGKTVFC